MKHNFSFLPSLRRTTLLALLCLGIMPAFAETVYYICFQRDEGYPESRTGTTVARDLYMRDKEDGVVEYEQQASNPVDDSYKWRKIDTQEDFNIESQTCDVVYLQNVGTGQYLYCSGDVASGDWAYRTTATGAKQENDNYRWFFVNHGTDSGYDICMITSLKDPNTGESFKSYHLHSCNQYNNCTDGQANIPKVPCGKQTDRNGYTDAKIIPVEYTPTDPCPNCGTVPANN